MTDSLSFCPNSQNILYSRTQLVCVCLDDKGYGIGLNTQDYSLKSALGHTVQEHEGIHSLHTEVDKFVGKLPRKKNI